MYRFILLFTVVQVGSLQYDGDDYEDVEDINCLPKLADRCFSNVYFDLECHFVSNPSPACLKSNAEQLCSNIEDSLQCASDEIDSSCKEEDGKFQFDDWMKGLMAAYKTVCSKDFSELQSLLNNSRCWKLLPFLECVKNNGKIEHIVDLLHSKLTWETCSHILLALATCSERATAAGWSCRMPQGIITDVFHAFFTNTDCAKEVCSSSSNNANSVLLMTGGFIISRLLKCILQH